MGTQSHPLVASVCGDLTPLCVGLCARCSRNHRDEGAGLQQHDRDRRGWNEESDRSVVGHNEMLGRTFSGLSKPILHSFQPHAIQFKDSRLLHFR